MKTAEGSCERRDWARSLLLSGVAFAIVAVTAGISRAQLANSPWPMFQHDPAHTGLSTVDTSGNPGLLKWEFETGQEGQATEPAIGADGTIYLSEFSGLGGGGILNAFNPNGMQKWVSNDFSEIFNSSPAIGADGTIYFGSTVPSYAVNPDGTLKWETTSGGNGYSSPAIGADGTVYFGTDDGLIAINTYVIGTCGTPPYTYACPLLKWAFTTAGSVASSPAIGANGTIYVGDSSGNLYSLTDGGQGIVTQNWAFTTGGPIESSPAFGTAAGTIYVGSNDGNLYAIVDDGTVGVEKWAFATGNPVFTTPAIGPDGTIYFRSDDGKDGNLYAVSDQLCFSSPGEFYPCGAEKWAFATNNANTEGLDSSPAIGADGTIYIGSTDSHLYAINPDGTLKWKFATATIVLSSPAIGGDGTIYVDDFYGDLYAVSAPATTMSVPASLSFGNSPVGDAVTKTITVKNTGNTNSLYIIGVTSSDPEFAKTSTTCPAAPGKTCTITISFTPSALGVRSALLTLSDNTATSPQNVKLSGTGTTTLAVAPASYGFGSVKDGSKAAKLVVVYNYQTNPVSLSESFSGPNAGDFSITPGGTCTSTLGAGSDCSLFVTFAPTAVGTESATLKVTDGPDPLGPYTVSFNSAATIPESLSVTKLNFGEVDQTASKTMIVTVTNNAATGSIAVTSLNFGGANPGDFAASIQLGDCSALGAGLKCVYTVTFTPSTETAESGTLSIAVAQDPNGGPPAVTLIGTGVTPLRVTPASINFGTVASGHSSTNRTVTVTNNGGAAVALSEGITIITGNSGDFAVTGGVTNPCPVPSGSLAGNGASCTYALKFTPSIDGAESATLGVSAAGDAASPHNVSLTGTGN